MANNYDTIFFKNASILALSVADAANSIVNAITPIQFNGLVTLINLVLNQRNAATVYTGKKFYKTL